MENNLIRDPVWMPAARALGWAVSIAGIFAFVYFLMITAADPAAAIELKRTHPNHMSGTGSGSGSSGYVPRQKNCNGSIYIVKKYLNEELTLVRDPEARKWCQFFHSNTCGLPTVSFVPDKKLNYSVKWFQSATAEVFVMYPGYSGCRVYQRKTGPRFLAQPEEKSDQNG